MEGMLSPADVAVLSGQTGNKNNDGFGFDNGAWWIIILLLFGWGRNGFGNGGGYGGNNDGCCGFGAPNIYGKLDGITYGISDATFALNNNITNGFNNVQSALCQGFNGINTAIMQNGYQTQAGFNALGAQLASCCCDIERGQDAIACQISNNARDIMIANDKNTDRIINYLTQAETDRLRTELQSAQFQLSQLSQTRSIIEQLLPVAKPAYLTCSPYAAAFGVANTGCGCC